MNTRRDETREPTIIDIGMVRLIARAIDGACRGALMTELTRLRTAFATMRPSLSADQAATIDDGLEQVTAVLLHELLRRAIRAAERELAVDLAAATA